MKKFISKISAVAVVSLITLSSSYAKTEGGYAGISIQKASVEHLNQDRSNKFAGQKYGDSQNSLGLDYKYAINVGGNVFLAPGVFLERIGTKSYDSSVIEENGEGASVAFNNRYGAKLDIGYDINDNTAVYFTNGVSRLGYRLSHVDATGEGHPRDTSGRAYAYFYGIGLLSHLNDKATLGIEYNTQDFKSSSLLNARTPGFRIKNQIDVFKLTVAYHF